MFDQFIRESRQKVEDAEHRRKINYSLSQSHMAFRAGQKRFSNISLARQASKNRKWDAIEQLPKYLEMFEARFTANGGKVIWARNTAEACAAVLDICREKKATSVVKSKSMVTEEIHLNRFLSDHAIDVVETDLGEYIQQLAGEPPYHIVAPSMHKSREEIGELFHRQLDVPLVTEPTELTMIARQKLRARYREAQVGITGVNFLVADIGGVAVTENEGNARLSTSFPKTHIAITGIEKLLPTVDDLALFWPMLAGYGSGQKITVYNSIFTGPRKNDERDGPDDMYVILLDNGRTNVIAKPEVRELLYCIRCGSCLNVCPVFQNVGGHTYRSTYSGPIGAALTQHLEATGEHSHLSFASSLCGSCTDACPVSINLHEILLLNRKMTVENGKSDLLENTGWHFWKYVSLSRFLMDLAGGRMKNFVVTKLFQRLWGKHRDMPVFATKSFSRWWRSSANKKS